MTEILPIILYALTAAGYGVFALLLVIRSRRQTLALIMALAAGLTAGWAVLTLAGRYDMAQAPLVYLSNALRDGGWLAVILALMERPVQARPTWRVLAVLTAVVMLTHAALLFRGGSLGVLAGVGLDGRLSGLVATILGCVLIENLVRNSERDKFWTVKYLVIGMAGILTFQFFIRVTQFLTQQMDPTVMLAVPVFYLLALPLFAVTAIRAPGSRLQLHSSRQVVFHTTTLVIAGIALQGTALAAYYLRHYGGTTGTALAIIFGFATFVIMAGVASSGALRSRLRLFINENFFNYKYDYRAEWNKFIRALSAAEESGTPLKVLRTFSDLMDSPGGALWVWKENFRQFLPLAKHSPRAEVGPIAPEDPALAAFENEACTLIDLTATAQPGADAWKRLFPDHWLIVPLRYRSRLIGIILLCRPRTRRSLNWEDYDLVALVAMQLAIYLMHDQTSEALHDARQMEEFNKRFAFLVHDMKNTIGQLDLLARNAERFGENPEFRKDMNTTLRNAVDKLNSLLVQIRGGDPRGDNMALAGDKKVDVVELVKAFVGEKRGQGLPVTVKDEVSPARATIADDHTLINVLEHVVANAIEVTPADADVDVNVQLSAKTEAIRIAVNDRGPGMSQEFINERLFRPFRTTKAKGFGIGAYQARENVRRLGGNFEVFSTEGRGTSIVISLPCRLSERAGVN
ncbi:MAG TPA: XrtA/PEP-CTERM system histidine kinase PrsK [Rhizomicrobium sp.]|jgi:putative PEP-CTERM system histidine kinase|nr:XrtA/PEP-CTERM system histidine kinase PrsK [Rhizomicrobium sp.]